MASPHRIYGPDKVGALSKVNSTTVQLAASSITLGGLQYDTAALQALTASNGAGGLDTGSVEADTKYYIYAILDGSEANIVASKSDLAPSGFTVSTRVGFFITDSATAVTSINEENKKTYWQKKYITNLVTTTGDIAELTFNNLEIGKSYKVTGQLRINDTTGTVNAKYLYAYLFNGGTILQSALWYDSPISNSHQPLDIASGPFVAIATDIRMNVNSLLNSKILGVGASDTYLIVEELPEHELTSKWA